MPGLRKERTTAREALAISIPRTEAGVDHLQSEILVKSPSEMRAAANWKSDHTRAVDEGDGRRVRGQKACLTSVSRRPHCQMFQRRLPKHHGTPGRECSTICRGHFVG